MAFEAVHFWTLAGLIEAFVDLAIAYFLLCVAAFAYFPAKFLSVFELYLPCPCNGLFGYQNSNLCLHELLIDWPTTKISYVLELVRSRFPFGLIWSKNQSLSMHVEGATDGTCEIGFVELEGEACSISLSGPRLQSSVDREIGHDAKGKKIMNQKKKPGIRRRRRPTLGYGKLSSILSPNSISSVGICGPHPSYDGNEMRSEISESLDTISGMEDDLLDDGNAPNVIDFGERTQCSFELGDSYGKNKDINKAASSIENFACGFEKRLGGVGSDATLIRMLEQALEEEKAARAALYLELEKERAAAATAADEAMSMILRLQEDKALIEMEARQYQRMIDEKFSYDEEEMNILKEILVRREREIHFLEKEVEAYQQMDCAENEQLEGINGSEQKPSFSINSNKNTVLMSQQNENNKSIGEKEVVTSANLVSNYEQSHTIPFGMEMTSNQQELASDLSSSQEFLQKTVTLAAKEKFQRDISIISEEMKRPPTFGGIGEGLEKDGECWDQAGRDVCSSTIDTEPTIYDVHVVNDKTVISNEDCRKKSGSLSGVGSDSGVCSGKLLSNFPSTSKAKIEPHFCEGSFDMSTKLPLLGNSQCKTLGVDSQRNSSSAVDIGRLKINTEVEWLRERLQIVLEEKEKLTFSAEHRERVNAQLKLVEEIMNRLREIQQLREPVQQASLPPSSCEVTLKKRPCRSMSWEAFESA